MVRATWYNDGPEYEKRSIIGARSVVKLLLIINVAAFVLDHLFHHFGGGGLFQIFGLHSSHFKSLFAPLRIYELITYQFLHGGLLHLGMNMLMLWFFGRELENHLGVKKFLTLYLVSGAVGGMFQVITGLITGNMTPVVGASGAIYGILIFYAMMWPHRTVIFIVIYMKARTMALIFLGISLLYGLFPTTGDGVAHLCHLGGALCGYLFFRYQGWFDNVKETIRIKQETRVQENLVKEEEEMDRLLAKIHKSGINSLTDSERKFLNKASQKMRKD